MSDAATTPDTLSWSAKLVTRAGAYVSTRLGFALADQIVYSFGNMIVAALISRHCAQRDFGIYILTQRSMDVLIQLSYVFLWGPFTFNLPGSTETRTGHYQGSMLMLQVLFCAFAMAGLAVFSWTASASGHGMCHSTFAPLALTAGGILFREFTRRMYFAHMRFQEAFWTDVATVTLQIVGVEWLYRVGKLDVPNTLLVLCLGAVLVSLWWMLREWRDCRFSASGIAGDLRLNLQLGRWFLGSNMVFLASLQCNPWMLGGLLGGASVGAYAVSESVINIPRVALNSMHNIMGPMMARAHHEGGRPALFATVRRLQRLLLVCCIPSVIAVWLAGPTIGQMIFRTIPAHARLTLGLLSLSLLAYAGTLAHSYGLATLQRANATFYANAAGFTVQVVACFYLVRAFHVPGAAAAMLLGNLIVLITRGIIFRREVGEVATL